MTISSDLQGIRDNKREVGTQTAQDCSCSGSRDSFDHLIFQQELSEVKLLLDYISGRPDRQFRDLDLTLSNVGGNKAVSSTADALEKISYMRYPPAQEKTTRAEDAAFLLLMKDKLNSLAHPARGLTVAYTIMFTRAHRSARSEAAESAFPGLSSSARRFQWLNGSLAYAGLIISVLSAIFFWQVTHGIELATQFEDAKKNEQQISAKLYEQLEKENKFWTINKMSLADICSLPASSSASKPSPLVFSSALRQTCDDYIYKHAMLCTAISDVVTYSRSRIFVVASAILPVHQTEEPATCGVDNPKSKAGSQEDVRSFASVLSMMSNYVLPILFGLVGTIAALVRTIQYKVNESVLAPQDQALTLIRLPLGVVAGASVGLFFSPPSAITSAELGNFSLHAPAIAFLAGYGAEGFFHALDALLVRIFGLDKESGEKPHPVLQKT